MEETITTLKDVSSLSYEYSIDPLRSRCSDLEGTHFYECATVMVTYLRCLTPNRSFAAIVQVTKYCILRTNTTISLSSFPIG